MTFIVRRAVVENFKKYALDNTIDQLTNNWFLSNYIYFSKTRILCNYFVNAKIFYYQYVVNFFWQNLLRLKNYVYFVKTQRKHVIYDLTVNSILLRRIWLILPGYQITESKLTTRHNLLYDLHKASPAGHNKRCFMNGSTAIKTIILLFIQV